MQSDPELERMRASIDNLDTAIICLLAERFKITQQVGYLKRERALAPADPDREAQQITRLRQLAAQSNLDPEFAEKLLSFIVAEVVRHHEAIASDDPWDETAGASDLASAREATPLRDLQSGEASPRAETASSR